ncbi:MAG: hypothetical protein FJW34_00060 [Acidobacteria bacterium]|nr:hypothetical protein [Acidobacteriota bacterium]
MSSYLHKITATIALGESLSGAVFIGGEFSLIAIEYPAAWDAAGIAFQVSLDGSNWHILRDDAGTELTNTVTAGQFREVDSSQFKSAIWLKIRSGTSSVPVAQTAARTLILHARRYIAR